MAEPDGPQDASAAVFAVRRRRVILAAGAITLTTAVAPRLLSGPAARADAASPSGRQLADGRPHRHVPAERAGDAGRRAHPSRPATASGPSYPHDKPLYYVDDADRAIALTIDDGPDPQYTPQILQVLEQNRVTATFSMIGLHVAAYPKLAQAVSDAGHEIANHTWTHSDLAVMSAHRVHLEFTQASQAIHAATGVHPRLFRAPYGAWSRAVIRECEALKMVPVDWSVDPRDWAQPGTRSIIRTIMRTTQPGSIILEHDGGGNRSETVAALKVALPRLLAKGYRFVTV
ncbi:MAG: polysaccharide deacetylase family protein [Streptosporangiaceae bacterium]